ncbi:MAG: ATP-binding protein [Chloroflexota bacterium]
MSENNPVEQELRDTRHILNRLLAVSPAVIYSTTPFPPYQVRYISENVTIVTGYSPDQFIEDANFWKSRVHPEDRLMVLEQLDKMQLLDFLEMEYRFLCADEQYHFLHEEIKVLRDTTGHPIEGIGYFIDVTRQRNYEEAIRQSENLYRSLAEASRDLIILISREKTIEYINSYARQALGWGESQTKLPSYAHILKLIPEGSIQQAFQTQQAVYTENSAIISKRKIWLGTWLVPISNPHNDVEFVMAVARDITRQRETEEELQRALKAEQELNSLRYRFLTMTTHEFKTPISTILSSIELLETYGERWSPEKRNDHINRIKTAAQRLNQMLSDVLEVNRVDNSVGLVINEKVDLSQLCHEVIREIQQSDQNRHPVIFVHTGELSSVRMDTRSFRNIISNLLSNAIKYSDPGKDVILELSTQPDHLWVKVHDRGIGVPEKDRENLFEPFYRGENVSSIPGTGLGLTIVKRSVEALGGEIHYEEKAGGGSVFSVRIPLKHLTGESNRG